MATVIKGKYIDVIDMTTWNGPNRPGYPMVPEYITVHETANPTPGADSIMHAKFVQNGGGAQGVSFHRSVDDHQSTKILNDNENGWHAGDGRDGPGNRKSLAIETCINSDGDWNKTKENLIKLVAQLCDQHNIPADAAHIVPHQHWSGKHCPNQMLNEGSLPTIISQAAALVAGGSQEQPARPDRIYFPQTQHWLALGFKAFYESHGDEALSLFGYPISEEFDLDGKTYSTLSGLASKSTPISMVILGTWNWDSWDLRTPTRHVRIIRKHLAPGRMTIEIDMAKIARTTEAMTNMLMLSRSTFNAGIEMSRPALHFGNTAMMKPSVFAFGHHLKIRNVVVRWVAVDVVNDFILRQIPAKMLFHHLPMLARLPFRRIRDANIAVRFLPFTATPKGTVWPTLRSGATRMRTVFPSTFLLSRKARNRTLCRRTGRCRLS